MTRSVKQFISKRTAEVPQYSQFAAESLATLMATAMDFYYITVLCTLRGLVGDCWNCLNNSWMWTSSISCNVSMTLFLCCLIIYLKGLPALIIQFCHLLSDPRGNVRDGHVDDVLQEDGKVLRTHGRVERSLGQNKKQIKVIIPIRYKARCSRTLFKGMLLELILAQHHLGREILPPDRPDFFIRPRQSCRLFTFFQI